MQMCWFGYALWAHCHCLRCFTVDVQLRDLLHYVKSTEWYKLGLELKVDVYLLDVIYKSESDNQDQLRRMFQEWLNRTEEPTWEAVVQALTAIGQDMLARRIEEQFV